MDEQKKYESLTDDWKEAIKKSFEEAYHKYDKQETNEGEYTENVQ